MHPAFSTSPKNASSIKTAILLRPPFQPTWTISKYILSTTDFIPNCNIHKRQSRRARISKRRRRASAMHISGDPSDCAWAFCSARVYYAAIKAQAAVRQRRALSLMKIYAGIRGARAVVQCRLVYCSRGFWLSFFY